MSTPRRRDPSIPVFTGAAAAWLDNYMATAQPDPAKAERAIRDREIVASFVTLEQLRGRA